MFIPGCQDDGSAGRRSGTAVLFVQPRRSRSPEPSFTRHRPFSRPARSAPTSGRLLQPYGTATMFPVTVTYVSTGAFRASVTVLIRPVADGPVNWAKDGKTLMTATRNQPTRTRKFSFVHSPFRVGVWGERRKSIYQWPSVSCAA